MYLLTTTTTTCSIYITIAFLFGHNSTPCDVTSHYDTSLAVFFNEIMTWNNFNGHEAHGSTKTRGNKIHPGMVHDNRGRENQTEGNVHKSTTRDAQKEKNETGKSTCGWFVIFIPIIIVILGVRPIVFGGLRLPFRHPLTLGTAGIVGFGVIVPSFFLVLDVVVFYIFERTSEVFLKVVIVTYAFHAPNCDYLTDGVSIGSKH